VCVTTFQLPQPHLHRRAIEPWRTRPSKNLTEAMNHKKKNKATGATGSTGTEPTGGGSSSSAAQGGVRTVSTLGTRRTQHFTAESTGLSFKFDTPPFGVPGAPRRVSLSRHSVVYSPSFVTLNSGGGVSQQSSQQQNKTYVPRKSQPQQVVKTTLTRWRRTPESKIRRCENRRTHRRDSRQLYRAWHSAVKAQSVAEAAESYGSRGPHKTCSSSHLEPSCGNTTSLLVNALKQDSHLIRHHSNSKFMNKHFKPTLLKHNQLSKYNQEQQQQDDTSTATPSQSSRPPQPQPQPKQKQSRTEWFKTHVTDPTPHNRQQHDM
jgi:hypothetical protein